MNTARLVKDAKGKLYLKITGKPLGNPAYFNVELFATEPQGKITDLTKPGYGMFVDLSGE